MSLEIFYLISDAKKDHAQEEPDTTNKKRHWPIPHACMKYTTHNEIHSGRPPSDGRWREKRRPKHKLSPPPRHHSTAPRKPARSVWLQAKAKLANYLQRTRPMDGQCQGVRSAQACTACSMLPKERPRIAGARRAPGQFFSQRPYHCTVTLTLAAQKRVERLPRTLRRSRLSSADLPHLLARP